MKHASAFLTAAMLAFIIAGCKQASEANNVSTYEINAAAPTDIEALPPSEDVIPPVTSDGATNEAAPANAVPAAFHGRWGMVPADCTSTRGDNKGLITIDSNKIVYYEARATLTKVTMNAPENFTGEFTFSGEGQTWTKSDNLKLTGNSNTLIRTETDPPVKLTYTRCA
jgi:hypothetical protein